MTKIQFHIKKSRFSVKSRFKETKCADRGHWLNRDFTVHGAVRDGHGLGLMPGGSFVKIFALGTNFTMVGIEKKLPICFLFCSIFMQIS